MVGLTLLVPAYNEEENLKQAVEKYESVLNKLKIDYEIIIVNDGSTDKTLEIAIELKMRNPKIRFIQFNKNRGLGAVYRKGVSQAKGKYFLMLSGEGDILSDSMESILDKAGEADMIIPYIGNPWARPDYRRFITWVFTTILNVRFGFDIKYYNGFVLHKTKLLRKVNMTTNSFAYQAEILVQLLKKKHSYIQIPYLTKIMKKGSSGFRLKNIIATMFVVFRMCVRGR